MAFGEHDEARTVLAAPAEAVIDRHGPLCNASQSIGAPALLGRWFGAACAR